MIKVDALTDSLVVEESHPLTSPPMPKDLTVVEIEAIEEMIEISSRITNGQSFSTNNLNRAIGKLQMMVRRYNNE